MCTRGADFIGEGLAPAPDPTPLSAFKPDPAPCTHPRATSVLQLEPAAPAGAPAPGQTPAPRPRALRQSFLDLGQKDFYFVQCPECGLAYTPGLPDDEALHQRHHARAQQPWIYVPAAGDGAVDCPALSGTAGIARIDGSNPRRLEVRGPSRWGPAAGAASAASGAASAFMTSPDRRQSTRPGDVHALPSARSSPAGIFGAPAALYGCGCAVAAGREPASAPGGPRHLPSQGPGLRVCGAQTRAGHASSRRVPGIQPGAGARRR